MVDVLKVGDVVQQREEVAEEDLVLHRELRDDSERRERREMGREDEERRRYEVYTAYV